MEEPSAINKWEAGLFSRALVFLLLWYVIPQCYDWTPWCVAGVSSPCSEAIGMMCMHTTLFFFVIDIAVERHQTFLCWHAVAIYDLPTDKQQKLDWLKMYTKDRFDYLQSFDDDITTKRSCIDFPLDISIFYGVFLLSHLLHFHHLDDSISGCNFSFS